MPELAPDDIGLADSALGWMGAYLHVPFCARVCPYCDFAVVAGAEETAGRYVDALIAEIERSQDQGPVHALHIGGGTPSRLSAQALVRMVDAVATRFGLTDNAEVSLEVNPEDWTPALAEGLAARFDRVSFGAQSFDPTVLDYLGRRHSPADVERAVSLARAAGFRSVNLDLIFGAPVESLHSWERTLASALGLGPDHLSCYALTVERGTALSRAVAAGSPAPNPDAQADAYETACSMTAAAGLRRYEVSNFARPGHAARYNLLTWAGGDYYAFGNAAHRHRQGRRGWNLRRLDAYLVAIEAGNSPEAGREFPDREAERLYLGLRRVAGARIGEAAARLLASPEGQRLTSAGVLAVQGERLVVLRPLLTDEVSRALLGPTAGSGSLSAGVSVALAPNR